MLERTVKFAQSPLSLRFFRNSEGISKSEKRDRQPVENRRSKSLSLRFSFQEKMPFLTLLLAGGTC
jgi:hypothetical protein